MIKIKLPPHASSQQLSIALKRLRKICDREGITKQFKRKQAYEKPSEKRNREKRKFRKINDKLRNYKNK